MSRLKKMIQERNNDFHYSLYYYKGLLKSVSSLRNKEQKIKKEKNKENVCKC